MMTTFTAKMNTITRRPLLLYPLRWIKKTKKTKMNFARRKLKSKKRRASKSRKLN